MEFPRTLFALALVMVGSTQPADAQSKGRQRTAQSPATETPASYRAEWSRIDSCDSFKSKLWLLSDARPLLARVASLARAQKSEFESHVEYRNRIAAELAPLIGDAERIYVIYPLKGDWAKYDAERHQMTVAFPSYTRGGHLPVMFPVDWTTQKGSTYKGTNAFGVSKSVQRQTRFALSTSYTFPAEITSKPIVFPMSGTDAELFKAGIGVMHIVGRVTGLATRRGRSSPTLARPSDTTYAHYEVSMQPRCAYITFGPDLIESWDYQAW